MKNKRSFWLMFTVIILLSWIDNQYFTEGWALQIESSTRLIGHVITFALIIPVGYIGCKNYTEKWFANVWLYSYSIIFILMLLSGFIQMKTNFFTTSYLDYISTIRQFFCSPVPYFVLYVLYRVINSIPNKA